MGEPTVGLDRLLSLYAFPGVEGENLHPEQTYTEQPIENVEQMQDVGLFGVDPASSCTE